LSTDRLFRRSKKSEWEWIARPTDGVTVTAANVIILRREFERYDALEDYSIRLQSSSM
jgi:hypothetical protein